MVVGRNEIDVFVPCQEIYHAAELARQVNVVVFSKIDNIGVPLFQEDLHLLPKCRLIAKAV